MTNEQVISELQKRDLPAECTIDQRDEFDLTIGVVEMDDNLEEHLGELCVVENDV